MSLKSMSSPIFASQSTLVAGSGRTGLNLNKPSLTPLADSVCWRPKTVSNGSRVSCMKTWSPMDNKKFETLSYLQPLSDDSVAKQIDYMIREGWVPCLELDEMGYVKRVNSQMPGYYDGRYWTMWKLPMFGCSDASQVLKEIEECKDTYPDAYIRCLAFDNLNQGQSMAFIVHKPLSTAI